MNLDPVILAELQRGGPPVWVAGRTYSAGRCVLSPTDWQVYMRATNGAGAVDPKNDGDNWVRWGAAIEAAVAMVSAAVTNVNAAVGGVSGKADAIQATVNAINAKSGIKSVQRGVVTPGAEAGATVTIGAVNPSKTMVFADFAGETSLNMYPLRIGAQLLSATLLNVVGFTTNSSGDTRYISVAWQVVEFY